MHALLLCAVLTHAPAGENELLAKLDAAVESLIEHDPHAADVRHAVRMLAETNTSDRWTQYSTGTAILRRTRSKAGIPLLLAYMVRHCEFGSGHGIIREYTDTIAILSGKDIPDPYRYVADRKTPVLRAVEKLVAEWWEPEHDRINTDIDSWSNQQMQFLAATLLRRVAASHGPYDPARQDSPTAQAIANVLDYRLLATGSSYTPDWRLEELHPAMLPTLLAHTGYRPGNELPPRRRDVSRTDYWAVELLAALRKNGGLDELDELADDPRQSVGTRLTCVLALYKAGEKLRTTVLLPLVTTDENLERRLVVIAMLKYAGDDRQAGAALVAQLDDKNAEIRAAAVASLAGPLPPQAVPKLKELITAVDTPYAMWAAFNVLGKYRNRAACQALADFLALALEDGRKSEYLYRATSALESATDQRWNRTGPGGERERAKAAITWWQTVGRLSFE